MGLGFLVFPELCPVCGRLLVKGERYICLGCLSDLPYSFFWNWRNNPAEFLLNELLPVEQAASLMLYRSESNWKSTVHQFKYYGNKGLGQFLSILLAQKLMESGWSDKLDLVVPVPLHWYKEWTRGFNQAGVVAKVIAEKLNLPYEPYLITRKRFTFTQTKKDKEHRKKSVASAFMVKEKYSRLLSGKRVLLVDDVLTTGATASSCGKALLDFGALSISVVTLAFVE